MYLNNEEIKILKLFIPRLTLTIVVFKFNYIIGEVAREMSLTLTIVVFKSIVI